MRTRTIAIASIVSAVVFGIGGGVALIVASERTEAAMKADRAARCNALPQYRMPERDLSRADRALLDQNGC